MEKLSAIFFSDVDKIRFYLTLKKLIVISFLTSFLVCFDGGLGLFIPIIIGSFIVHQFYEEKQRIKFLVYFLPFIFLAIFFTAGGFPIFFRPIDNIFPEDSEVRWLVIGIWSGYMILLTVWCLFKVRIKLTHFLLITLLLPIAYLSRTDRMDIMTGRNASAVLFYFLWNTTLSVVLSLLFSQKPLAKQNL